MDVPSVLPSTEKYGLNYYPRKRQAFGFGWRKAIRESIPSPISGCGAVDTRNQKDRRGNISFAISD